MLSPNYSSDCLQSARLSLCALCVYVCLREWVGCSGVHGVYYWSPAVLHLSLFSVVKHEAKSLLNLGAHSTHTHTHTHTHNQLICVFCLSFKKYELTQTLGQQKCQYKFLTHHSSSFFSSFKTTNIIRPGIKEDSCFDS